VDSTSYAQLATTRSTEAGRHGEAACEHLTSSRRTAHRPLPDDITIAPDVRPPEEPMTSHSTPPHDPPASPEVPAQPRGTPLPAGHYETYQAARSHLWALAASLPATSPHGYWDVLDLLDDLHDPLSRPPVDIDPTPRRAEHYAAAREALADLAHLTSAPPGLDRCTAMLRECWKDDPGGTGTDSQEEP
jgi:hypothetical protein